MTTLQNQAELPVNRWLGFEVTPNPEQWKSLSQQGEKSDGLRIWSGTGHPECIACCFVADVDHHARKLVGVKD